MEELLDHQSEVCRIENRIHWFQTNSPTFVQCAEKPVTLPLAFILSVRS